MVFGGSNYSVVFPGFGACHDLPPWRPVCQGKQPPFRPALPLTPARAGPGRAVREQTITEVCAV